MGHPEDRTHGADSAIDDEIIAPRNMTDQADAKQDFMPGAEAIPADMPDAPRGEMPLEYNLQTFNALVAANTAMETEISSLNEKMDLIAQQRDGFKEALDDARGTNRAHLTQIKDLQQADKDRQREIADLNVDLDFAKDTAATLQRRLDRALGYTDRVLDEEDAARAPESRVVPAPRPEVGPALGMIPDPVRRSDKASDRMWDRAMSASSIRFDDGATQRHRRY